jgi:hypothetical protein
MNMNAATPMGPAAPARVLILTDRPEPSPSLVAAVRERAAQGPARFFVLVPNPASAEWHPFHPERHDAVAAAERALLHALPTLQDAAGDAVRGHVSLRHDPLVAVEERLFEEAFDEIVLAMTPPRHRHGHGHGRWPHAGLARRLRHLGLPVTTVEG